MVTLLPSGASLMAETVPTWTPDMSTWARVFKPPTLWAVSRMLYVGRKKLSPFLNCSSSTASSTRPMKTNKPTFHSSRDLSILKAEFFRIGYALNKLAHDRVLGVENLVWGSGRVN